MKQVILCEFVTIRAKRVCAVLAALWSAATRQSGGSTPLGGVHVSRMVTGKMPCKDCKDVSPIARSPENVYRAPHFCRET